MRPSGLFLRAIMGTTGLSGLQLQNKTLRLAMSQLSKSSTIFFINFCLFSIILVLAYRWQITRDKK